MTDYISREAALDRIVGYDFQHCPDYMEDWATELKHAVICDLKDAVETLPAADVVPVVHGEWVVSRTDRGWNGSEYPTHCKCTHCGREIPYQERDSYCPSCGASMRQE